MELATNSNAQSTPIPDRWEDSMQVAGVPPLWGALAALATLVGKKATQKIMKKIIDAGVKDPKKQQQLIKKQIEKVKGKGAGDAAIAAGEVALNEYLHYTKKQEDAGEPRDKLVHRSDFQFSQEGLHAGLDGLVHLSEEPIEQGRANTQFYKSDVPIGDMVEMEDRSGWYPLSLLEKAVDAGIVSSEEQDEVLRGEYRTEENLQREVRELLISKGVNAFKYKNKVETPWEYADRDGKETYSVGVLDPNILQPAAQFLHEQPTPKKILGTGMHYGAIRDFDLGGFAPEEVEHPPLWERVSKEEDE